LDSPEFDGQAGVEWVVKAVAPDQQTPFLTDVTFEDVLALWLPPPSLDSPSISVSPALWLPPPTIGAPRLAAGMFTLTAAPLAPLPPTVP
jgi:hypothetical protein